MLRCVSGDTPPLKLVKDGLREWFLLGPIDEGIIFSNDS